MDKERRQFEEKHFVEDVGLFFEQEGLPRMAGRILGWLLLSDPPHQSTDELAQVLQASKGSISTMTRLLIQADLVERVALPGMRRDHFRLRPGAWSHMIKQELFRACATRQLAERGLELLDSRDAALIDRLKEMRDLYAFLEKEYPALLDKWERERKKSSR